MKQLKPLVNEMFDGVIWRLETDAVTNTVFVETRNAEDRLVGFSAIDLKKGVTSYKNITVDEKWLAGIEAAFDGVLLLHGYQNESSPTHKGLTAINTSGKILWNNYNYAFDHLSSHGPVVYNLQIQQKKRFLIDVQTGHNVQSINGFEPEADRDITYPEPELGNLDVNFPVKAVLNSIYYSKYNSFLIVSLHAESNLGFNQHLYVFENGVIVFEDILNKDIQKLQPEAFILFKDYLLYIKNKCELKVLNL